MMIFIPFHTILYVKTFDNVIFVGYFVFCKFYI